MTGVDSQTLVWDDNGNMTTGVGPDFVYNWDNKLRSASVSGGDSIDSIKYDPDGNRIYKESTVSSQSVKRKYIVDIVGRLPVILLIMDAGNDNSVVNTYVYANSQVLAQYEGTQEEANDKHFYLHDRLGSVRLLIDESGDVANVYTYQPYGQLIATETAVTTKNPFKFTGQWFDDEIDQYYLRARQYDPQISRFTSRDPVSGTFSKPMTLNVYLYCVNNPVNCTDLTGLLYTIEGAGLIYNYEQTQQVLDAEIAMVGEHWRHGPMRALDEFDYKGSNLKFLINDHSGRALLIGSEFGNYAPAYAMDYVYGRKGEYAVRLAGNIFASGDYFLSMVGKEFRDDDSIFNRSKLLAPLWEAMMFSLFNDPMNLDDYGSRYWITRGVLESHKQLMEQGKRSGWREEIRGLQLRVYENYYYGLHFTEQIIGMD